MVKASQNNNTIYFSLCPPSAAFTRSIRSSQLLHSTSVVFWPKLQLKTLSKTPQLCVVSDRPQFPTWTKHWSQLGWDRAMKEVTIPCSKTVGNCLCTKLGFCWRCEREHRPVGRWNLHFLKCSFISRMEGAKMSSMYTFVLNLAPCFTKIRGDFQVFDTAA